MRSEQIVADKNCEKIHFMAPNMYCAGAGTAADTEQVTRMISSQLTLLRLQTGRQSRVVSALTMLKRMLFRYQGHVGAYLVLGGVDLHGPHLHTVWAAGSTDTLPYVSMGSGSIAATAVLETRYREGMGETEAAELVRDAILAGIFNDLGSGSNVDVCIMRTDGSVENRRNWVKPNDAEPLRAMVAPYSRKVISRGATIVLKEIFEKHIVVDREVREPAAASAASAAAAGGGAVRRDADGDEEM